VRKKRRTTSVPPCLICGKKVAAVFFNPPNGAPEEGGNSRHRRGGEKEKGAKVVSQPHGSQKALMVIVRALLDWRDWILYLPNNRVLKESSSTPTVPRKRGRGLGKMCLSESVPPPPLPKGCWFLQPWAGGQTGKDLSSACLAGEKVRSCSCLSRVAKIPSFRLRWKMKKRRRTYTQSLEVGAMRSSSHLSKGAASEEGGGERRGRDQLWEERRNMSP